MRVDAGENLSAQLGRRLTDKNGTAVGILQDIKFNADGVARFVVLQDGGFFGHPDDLVVLPYKAIFKTGVDHDVLKTATPQLKRQAQSQVMTTDIAASSLLHAGIYAADGLRLADVDDFILRNGRLDQILLLSESLVSKGQRLAAIPFREFALQNTISTAQKTNVKFIANPQQAAVLMAYKARHAPHL